MLKMFLPKPTASASIAPFHLRNIFMIDTTPLF